MHKFLKFIFVIKLYMFRTVPASTIRSFSLYTQQCVQVRLQLASRISSWSCSQEFYSKNKFEKLVHLVGFIIKIYHDARSPEHQYTYKDVCSKADSSCYECII